MAQTAALETDKTFNFMSLPSELRLEVYKLVSEEEQVSYSGRVHRYGDVLWERTWDKSRRHHALLFVSKDIHREYSAVIYESEVVTFLVGTRLLIDQNPAWPISDIMAARLRYCVLDFGEPGNRDGDCEYLVHRFGWNDDGSHDLPLSWSSARTLEIMMLRNFLERMTALEHVLLIFRMLTTQHREREWTDSIKYTAERQKDLLDALAAQLRNTPSLKSFRVQVSVGTSRYPMFRDLGPYLCFERHNVETDWVKQYDERNDESELHTGIFGSLGRWQWSYLDDFDV